MQKTNNAFWVRIIALELVVLIAMTIVLVVNINPVEIGLIYLILLEGIVIVGLMTNTKMGLVASAVSIFIISLFNRYSGVYIPETTSVNGAAELIAFFLVGPIAGRLGETIGQIQRQANQWQTQAEAQTVHDKLLGTLKPAWAEVRLKEEMMRARQFGRPLSVLLLQVNPEPDISTKADHDRTAVLQAVIRLSQSLTQPPAVVTCLDENQVLLILPEYSGEQADELGQRLSAQSANVLYFPDKKTKSLGKAVSQWGQVRIGAVSLNGHNTSPEMLLAEAVSKLTGESMNHRTNGTHSLPLQETVLIKPVVEQTPQSLATSDK
jgi:GGDEF domain-containing protein